MAWIESHQSLRQHPKLFALCATTGWSRPEAIGRLHLLWWWVLDYAEDGDASGTSAETLAHAMETTDDPNKVREALVSAGFLNSDGHLHDWMDYAAEIVRARIHKRKQRRKMRDARIEDKYGTGKGQARDRRGTLAGQNCQTVAVASTVASTVAKPSTIPLSSSPSAPVEFAEEWAKTKFPQIQKWGADRQAAWKQRLRDPWWATNWKAALQRAVGSDFLEGRTSKDGWHMGIDFFLRDSKTKGCTVAHILEGKYDNRKAPAPGLFGSASEPLVNAKGGVTTAGFAAMYEAAKLKDEEEARHAAR